MGRQAAGETALTEFPDVNASFADNMLTRHKHVNMGLAVAKGDGLIVPNVKNCEMSCILPVRDGGIVYFFSMATSFTKAALGAEGVGKDLTMIVGNGYTKGHAETTLEELRENQKLKDYFQAKYI